MTTRTLRFAILALASALALAPPAFAQSEQQTLVDECLVTWKNFQADPDMTWFREHDRDAVGLTSSRRRS